MVYGDVLIIGLTGGIASGKSTVADCFVQLGIDVIDTDDIAREVVQPGTTALQQLRLHFGDHFLHPDGSLNRQALGAYVFANPGERKWLEDLLHPLIWEKALQRARQARGSYSMIAVPLLLETAAAEKVDRVLVVDCPEEVQLQRAVARGAGSAEQVKQMMAAQLPRAQRVQRADDVIINAGTLEELQQQVTKQHQHYLDLIA